MAEKGKMDIKSGVLGAKSGFLDLKKYGLATNLERQSGAKKQVLGLKIDKPQGMKTYKKRLFIIF